MTWLMAHMWLVLSGVGLLAAVLGWSVRGMLLVGKLRQAAVERDVARVELATAREEIEKLFKVTRQPAAAEADLRAEIASRDSRIAELTAELAKAPPAADESVTTPAPALAAAVPEEDTLVWRNRHLEQRVAFLESELAAAQASAPATPPTEEVAGGSVETAKLAWESDYLRQRVTALEAELLKAPASATPPPPAAAVAAPAASLEGGKTVEEELAALRWRNRFLEGRVAYFEGEGQSAAAPPQDAAPPMSETILGQLEAADAVADADSGPEPERPPALDKAVDGRPDDLTVIGGIGPKIQDVLNSLGVFHFDQIAAWTPANVAWVDQHLSFSGRITREGWVEQAAVLVRAPADS